MAARAVGLSGFALGCLLAGGCRGAPEAVPTETLLRAGWNHGVLAGVTSDVLVPSAATPAAGRPLLIVLHGCSQVPDDLLARVDFDSVAASFDAVIAVPKVPNGGQYLGCWDYYGSSHSRTSGDSGKLLDLVDTLLANRSLGIDPGRVWISGLSSGGGMAMVMGCLAPDVFSGVGIAAGPTVGTTAFQIASVSTTLTSAKATCSNLAGSHSASFATQLASVIAGTSDFTVAQGYAPLNADVFAAIYGTGGDALTAAPFDVTALHGYNPAGTGTISFDGLGARVQRISAQGMGHAWPAGTGPGPEVSWVATQGVDYAWTLAAFFSENARRTEPSDPIDPPVDEPPVEDPPADDPGDPVDDPAGDPSGDCWVERADDDINGHLDRYDVYPAGYGVADETYVDLLDDHGVFGSFPLFLGSDGAWYADPSHVPGC